MAWEGWACYDGNTMTCDGEIPRLPDPEHEPMQWLLQFAEALDDIAFGVGNIV